MLAAYDPTWPDRFREVAAEIRAATGEDWSIEHIGSTAVPDLAAKPIIDLAVRVNQLTDVDRRATDLARIGFLAIAAGPTTHRVRVRMAGAQRTHVAHFFPAPQWEHCNQRLFRDWLLTHPADRDRYEQVKRVVAAATDGSREYTARKTVFVQEIVNQARDALGLPHADVWDK